MPDDTAEPTPPLKQWRELAEKASKEKDRIKLLKTINDLCKALEREAEIRKPPTAAKF